MYSYRVNGVGVVGDTTVTIDDVDTSGNTFNVGDLISFFSDSGHDTPIDDFNEYEVTNNNQYKFKCINNSFKR